MNNINNLIKNLEMLDKEITKMDSKTHYDFLDKYFPHTIDETIEELYKLQQLNK